MTADQKAENALRLYLKELGPSESVARFLRGYGNVRTRCAYAGQIVLYLRWLKGKGITMSPDELMKDNLRSVFESAPTDVVSKRRHSDLLSEYANSYLIEQGYSESKRTLAEAAIRGLYAANDSALFGHWRKAQQTLRPSVSQTPGLLHPLYRKRFRLVSTRP